MIGLALALGMFSQDGFDIPDLARRYAGCTSNGALSLETSGESAGDVALAAEDDCQFEQAALELAVLIRNTELYGGGAETELLTEVQMQGYRDRALGQAIRAVVGIRRLHRRAGGR